MRPVLLDLFCGAGGAGVGYERAGFDVVGVDLAPQRNYPYQFFQSDALAFDWAAEGIRPSAIHASPPCQRHVKGLAAVNERLGRKSRHLDLVAATRDLLESTGLPYVIENVVGAPLRDPIRLCGTSFGLPLRRHRLFESNILLLGLDCAHHRFAEKRYWTSWIKDGERQRATTVQVYGNGGEREHWGPAMGIDWMTYRELAEAIPPAFTEYVGRQLLRAVRVSRV